MSALWGNVNFLTSWRGIAVDSCRLQRRHYLCDRCKPGIGMIKVTIAIVIMTFATVSTIPTTVNAACETSIAGYKTLDVISAFVAKSLMVSCSSKLHHDEALSMILESTNLRAVSWQPLIACAGQLRAGNQPNAHQHDPSRALHQPGRHRSSVVHRMAESQVTYAI